MAVRRMNELWKTMALALMFGFLFLHSCQGQDSNTVIASSAPDATPNPSVTPSTDSDSNTATDSPASLTSVVISQTPEPSKPSSGSTTQSNAPSESSTSGNSNSTILATFTTVPAETTASRNTPKLFEEKESDRSRSGSEPEKKTEEDTASGSSPAVFVSVLVTGLLLAALIVGIYYFKSHRRSNGKGMKLAEESYMADEENQGNTLVSVAPLNQPEPQEKPSLNGESQEAVKPQTPPAATNGHSTTKTADTEL
ncbi:putative uncharacterized protein DDB_G0290521 [Pimephales promelas]|uniref:putative uncharacterized protein DDB_G0290521 n=1 Tax=Pimephales promelas TaxID=90988 RepID=UPI001955680D|nr:putative uncharacterized protein DDB_G0290521 [Pimephales promelas]